MAKVKLISKGMEELLKSREVADAVRGVAVPIEAAAKASAPVESGEYRASIHLEEHQTDRAVVRVVADAPHAAVVESRTGNLARAAGAGRRT